MKTTWEMIVPVISMGHVQEKTIEYLKRQVYCALGIDTVFVFVGDDQSDVWEEYPDMVDVVDWFREQYPNETWIRFDADGDVIASLPTYDW